MIKSITVVNPAGERCKCVLKKPEDTGFNIYNAEGLGPGQADINMTDEATNDGSVYNSARVQSREILFTIQFMDYPDIETARHRSYRFFPIKKRILIIVETTNRTTEIYGYVQSNEPVIFAREEYSQISVLCPFPYWQLAQPSLFLFHEVEPMFEWPFSNQDDHEDWYFNRTLTWPKHMYPKWVNRGDTFRHYVVGDRVSHDTNITHPEWPWEYWEKTSNTPDPVEPGVSGWTKIGTPEPYVNDHFKVDRQKTTRTNGWSNEVTEALPEELLEERNTQFGSYRDESVANIFYDGDADAGVIITIHATGLAHNISVVKIFADGVTPSEPMAIDSAKLIAITGSDIIDQDEIIISTIVGDKYVILRRAGVDYNILNALDKNAKWPKLTTGDNLFTYVAETGSPNLQLNLEYHKLYEGV